MLGQGGGLPKFLLSHTQQGLKGGKARDQDPETAFLFSFCNELAVFPWADQFLSLKPSFLIFYNQMQNLQGFPFQFKRALAGAGCV